MYTLHVKPVRGKPFSQPLRGDSLVIGRSRSCDLVLNDEAISRRHARLVFQNERWFVEDLKSRNGTLLDEAPVNHPLPVKDRCLINLSGNTIYISREDPTATVSGEPSMFGGTVLRRATDILNVTQTSDIHEQDEQSLRHVAGRLAMVNEVHTALCKPLSTEELLELILEKVFQHLSPEEGCIFLNTTGEKGRLELAARRAVPGLRETSLYSQTLVREVAEGGLAALVADVATDERFSSSDSMVNAGIRSLVAAPLLDSEGCLGMIVLASRMAVRSFSEEDMQVLVSLASLAALRIRNMRLLEEAARSLRDANQVLERKVAERTAELEATNDELRQKNDEILRTQNQLLIQQKMASLGTMAAGVAHLIKNPLNFVKNLSEVSGDLVDELGEFLEKAIAQQAPDDQQQVREILKDLGDNARIVLNHGVRADQIVVALMEYAREPAKVDRRPTDLNALVEKYAQFTLHGFLAKDENLKINLSHDHDASIGKVSIFAGDLSRALMNLVNNAVEAIIEKKQELGTDYQGEIKTLTRRVNKRIEITVWDNGVGIPSEHQKEIFTPFFTTKHDESHIGLGLSICYDNITQHHQGELQVDSQEGEYTKIILALPL